MYKKGEKINAKVIKTQGVMERKRLKQQKISFVNSIFNSSVSKLAIHLWPNENHGNRRQITKKRVFFEKVESLSFSKKGSIP